MTSQKADQVREYLIQQRWYAGKGREFSIEAIDAMSWLSTPGSWPAVRIELVTVRYTAGDTDVYQLPISYWNKPLDHFGHAHIGQWELLELGGFVFAYDALHDKVATSLWLRGLLAERAESDLAFRLLGDHEIDPEEQSLVLGVEQTNTSLVFGDTVLLKVFRQLHHGRNPDVEVHEALTRDGCTGVAHLFGWLEGQWASPGGATAWGDLAMFNAFLKTATDGWEQALTSVRDLYAEADLHPDEVGGDFAGETHRLGATTAQIHRALARLLPTGVLDADDLAALATRMRRRLDQAVQAIPELASYAAGLHLAYDALEVDAHPVPVQRIHGDFHLGQSLRTVAGWRLIDFEGEPARPFSDRATLDSPIRDIAGMLRSFDYAAQALLVGQLASQQDTSQLIYRAHEWAERNRTSFCEGYGEVAGTDPRERDALLRAYETDKAVYEVMYEARNRPDWLPIPLAAVERLATEAGGHR